MRAVSRRRLGLPALAVALTTALARAAGAAPSFTPEGRVLLTTASVQAIESIAGGHRMYFVRDGFHVYSATATDMHTWKEQTGIRLSTGTDTAALDKSSITSCGVILSSTPADGYRMYYVGVSSAGFYSILSATSTDGLAWGKESAGFRLQVSSGPGFIDSPRPFRVSNGLIRLYYVADRSGRNDPANYRVFEASSTDGGLTFIQEGEVLSGEVAHHVSISTLTDGRFRLYYSQPLPPSTTVSQVLSALSTTGTSFTKESDTRLSTSATTAALAYPVVARSTTTDSHRWRMYASYIQTGTSTRPFVSSALTYFAAPQKMTPATMLKNGVLTSFTIDGEVFSTAPVVTFNIGSSSLTATGLARVSDIQLTGNLNTVGASVGTYNAVVRNVDGRDGTLSNALFIDVPGGSVTIVDNLFRPLKGGSAKITAQVFGPGRLTLKLYTLSGGLVATIFDGDVSEGAYNVNWPGRTSLGNMVASGVYLLRATGPKLNTVQKIVVIK